MAKIKKSRFFSQLIKKNKSIIADFGWDDSDICIHHDIRMVNMPTANVAQVLQNVCMKAIPAF